MHPPNQGIFMSKRFFLKTAAALATAAYLPLAFAQTTPIKFQLDWRFEGPSALFLTPAAKGYFKDAKLDVTIDAGNGSGGTVTRVASGAYDMGFADLAALMEFHANNPDAPNKPVAVMMVYNDTPASVMALKKSGIKTPADLSGKKLGAPVFDAGRRAFPIFAKANAVTNVAWTAMDPPLRETMLVRGDVDAITGFTFTSLLNLEARGVKAADVTVLPYPDYGVKLYGNAIIASPKMVKENPAAIKAFLAAFAKGAKDVIINPVSAIADVKARDGIVNVELETRRLKLAIDTVINSPNARAEGFGQVNGPRLSLMASQVSDAFNTKTRVNADTVWNGSFLPAKAVLDVLPKK
jgi:NitT/TauT family transport system substrate-binding protein